MSYGKDTVCSVCHGEIGPDVEGRIMCYGCGPDELLPPERRAGRGAQSVRAASMKALVWRGKLAIEERPLPKLEAPADAIVRILCTSISPTDLHVANGDVRDVPHGRVLGREGVGVIEQVGGDVSRFARGDRVVISAISSCGGCAACRRGMASHCAGGGGWTLGRSIDGTQAELVRVPFADNSLHPAPAVADFDALALLSDVFPAAFECGVEAGRVNPGDTVLIVGAGSIGLAALQAAQLHSPAQLVVVDVDAARLEQAMALGATAVVCARGKDAAGEVRRLTGGVDVAIEAAGAPDAFELCAELVAPGGHIANIGVHGRPATLRLDELWARNVTITTRLVSGSSIPMLLRTVQSGRLQPRKLVTHTFALDQLVQAYAVFAQAAQKHALKVLIKNG